MTANNHQSREEPIDGLSLRARREARLAPGGEGAVFRSYAAMSLMLAALIVWDHWLIIGLPVIGVLLVALVMGMWFRLSRRMRTAMKRANSTSTQPNQERTEEQQDQHDHGSQDGSKEEGTVEEAAPYRVDRERARAFLATDKCLATPCPRRRGRALFHISSRLYLRRRRGVQPALRVRSVSSPSAATARVCRGCGRDPSLQAQPGPARHDRGRREAGSQPYEPPPRRSGRHVPELHGTPGEQRGPSTR